MTTRLQTACLSVATMLTLLMFSSTVSAQDASSVENGDRFVAVGQLASVTKNGTTARYVLLDEAGAVTASLRPATGVKLTKFIGQEVGVTARTLVDADTPILLAESVTTFGEARQVSGEDIGKHIALASHESEIQLAANSVLATGPVESIVETLPPTTYGPVLEGPIVDGAIMDGTIVDGTIVGGTVVGGPVVDAYASTSCGSDGCGSCGGGCGKPSCVSCAACPCGIPGRFWIRGEYLMWWTKEMDTPPLVTTSTPGTPREDAGVLGQPNTSILYGGDPLFSEQRSGARFRIGRWWDDCNWVGFETDFFFLGTETDDFSCTDVGSTIYARPFFNVNNGENDAELVQYPNILHGSIGVDAETSLWSISPRLRVNLSCEKFAGCNPCDTCNMGGYRFDLLVGYRFMQLEESLGIHESLATVGSTAAPTYFDLRDNFDSSNEFHGADLGFIWEGYRGPWSLELIGRVGIGQTSQEVTINGSTRTTSGSTTFVDPGGLLALEPNIGTYTRDEFTVLPEFSATLGYALSARSRFLVGYTFIYWDNVARAGDHIDTSINTDFLPPVQATDDEVRPTFAWNDASYWAQGLSLGLEYRW